MASSTSLISGLSDSTSAIPLTCPAVSKSHMKMWQDFASRIRLQSTSRYRDLEWKTKFEWCHKQYSVLKCEEADPWHQLLHELCDYFYIEAQEKMKDLAESKKTIEQKAIESCQVMKGLKSTLGRILFVADYFSPHFQQIIFAIDLETVKPERVLCYLNQYFHEKINFLIRRSIPLSESVTSFPIQDLRSIARVQACFIIAQYLLTSKGTINRGIVPDLQQALKNSSLDQNSFPNLNRISSDWQMAIEHVKVPNDPYGYAAVMIRADLGVKWKESITLRHCQIEMLSAMLYISSDPHRNPTEELMIFRDYWNLIKDECLSNSVKSACLHRGIQDDKLKESISIDQSGLVEKYKQPFWKCPQLIAACRQMGCDDINQVKDQIESSEGYKNRDPSELLSWNTLIEFACQNFSSERNAILQLGRYGFSLTHHRLVVARQNLSNC